MNRSERLLDVRDERGEQGGARNDAREIEPLGGGVIVAADRAEPVEGREAGGRGRVRVARPAGPAQIAQPSSPIGEFYGPARGSFRAPAAPDRVALLYPSRASSAERVSGLLIHH